MDIDTSPPDEIRAPESIDDAQISEIVDQERETAAQWGIADILDADLLTYQITKLPVETPAPIPYHSVCTAKSGI